MDQLETYEAFNDLVNMSPSELEKWLEREESKEVGLVKAGNSESQGRKSARKIIAIKRKHKAELDEKDYDHMGKVVSYIKRHLAQKPKSDIEDSRWRYSLKNWGHDPIH